MCVFVYMPASVSKSNFVATYISLYNVCSASMCWLVEPHFHTVSHTYLLIHGGVIYRWGIGGMAVLDLSTFYSQKTNIILKKTQENLHVLGPRRNSSRSGCQYLFQLPLPSPLPTLIQTDSNSQPTAQQKY